MRNLRLAVRTLARTPFVTVVAVVSLALGIGANAAIFSLFNQLLLRPLPVGEPHRLVNLAAPGPKPGSNSCNMAGNCDAVMSYPMFRDLEQRSGSVVTLAAHVLFGANLAARGHTMNGQAVMVSGSYFPVLGVHPALGRLLRPGDDPSVGESHVVVLSYAYWQTRFGGDPSILNQTLIVNGQPMTVVGVAPREFTGTTIGANPTVYVPITMRPVMQPNATAATMTDRRAYWAYVFGRLQAGVPIEQARAALNVQYHAIVNDLEAPLQKGMSDQTRARFRAKALRVEDGARGQSSVSGQARAPMTLLLGVTVFVLLIACANIANLLLARAAARSGEMAVRLSIGASRWQLVSQLLTESAALAALGGATGLLVARWTLSAIGSLLPADALRAIDLRLDGAVLAFAAAVTMATAVLFGLFPALHSTRPDLVSTLKGQAGQPSGGRAASRFRTSLATAQIALSMMLLVAAGLFTKSLVNISRADLGVSIDHVITFSVAPVLNGYTPERSKQFFERLENELAALPGVNRVSDGLVPLLAGDSWNNSVEVEGFKSGPDVDTSSAFNEIGPGYFRTLGVPLLAGRDFTPADTDGAPKVVIVNEAFAKKFNLGANAVGRHIGQSERNVPETKLDIEIVGLVRNAKYADVKDEVPPVFFRPYRQDKKLGFMTFYARTSQDPEHLLAYVPKLVAQIDPDLPVADLRTMPQQVRENVFLDRFITVLAAAFAALATLLAAIGLYGVLAYTVAQRTREIGLRMALGAAPARVRSMVLRQVAMMTSVGGVLGLVVAAALGRLAQALLYEMRGYDAAVLTASAATLTLVALGAGLLPAYRASQVDPMLALRYE